MLKSSSKSFKSISMSRLCDQQYSSVEQKGILATLSSVTEAFLIFSPEISKKNIQQKYQRELSHKNIKQKYQREKSNRYIKHKYETKIEGALQSPGPAFSICSFTNQPQRFCFLVIKLVDMNAGRLSLSGRALK